MTYKFAGEGELPHKELPHRELNTTEGAENSSCELARKTWSAMHPGDMGLVTIPNCSDSRSIVPNLSISDAQTAAKEVLVNPKASGEEKLRAVEALVHNGIN